MAAEDDLTIQYNTSHHKAYLEGSHIYMDIRSSDIFTGILSHYFSSICRTDLQSNVKHIIHNGKIQDLGKVLG